MFVPRLPAPEPELKGTHIIPVCAPDIGARERRYLLQAFDSSWISASGDFVEQFEEAFAKTVSKTRFAVSVNSGTSALHVALAALGIGPGDEVTLPTFTMIATVNAVSYCRATPVLVDSDPQDWNINVSKIEEKITKKTKAIIAVHTYGMPADMERIMAIARKHTLVVVEDSSEAHGAHIKLKTQSSKLKACGGIGDVGVFSLYANKLVTTGEGGVVTTNDPGIAKRVRLLRNHAFSQGRHFWHTMIGFSYKMTNLQAAIGFAQVERFDELFAKKQAVAESYRAGLADVSGMTLPPKKAGFVNSHWMFGILIDRERFGMDKDELRKKLAARGIETRSFFVPIHAQPVYRRFYVGQRFPVAERLCRDGLYLPSSTTLSKKDIQRVVNAACST